MTPTDRLDDAYLQRKREEEQAEIDAWWQAQTAPSPQAAPGGAETAETGQASAAAPTLGEQAVAPFVGAATRSGRLLREGGEAIVRGAGRIVEASPVGVAQRALAGEPPASPLAELQQAGAGALEIAGGMGTGAGVLVGQGAVEQALAGNGVPEAQAREVAELLVGLGVPIAATKIPAIAKAVSGGSASRRVLREIIGVPETGPAANAPVEPEIRAPKGEGAPGAAAAPPPPPELASAHEALQALAKDWDRIKDTARRGTRTHEQAMAEGQALPMSLDDVRALFPGTAMNDAQAARLITVLVDTAQGGQALARQALDSGDPAQQADALRAFALLMDADPKRSGVVAEAGRTLSVLNEPISGMNQYLDAVIETLVESSGLAPEALLKRLAAIKRPEEYAKLAKQLATPTWKDAFVELWINGLLSSPQTHVVNTVSNTLTAAWAIPERLVGSAFGALHGGLQPAEAYHATYGAIQGVKDGWRLAAKAFRDGAPASKLDQPLRRAIRGETFGLTGDLARGVDLLGEGVRTPTRFLMATDEFFKGVNFRMELHAQAYRKAAEEGLTGKAAAQRMAAIIENPPPSVKAAADDFALYQTFQRELTDRFTKGASEAFSGPVGKLFVPFIKTPTNIFKFSLERTPFAPLIGSWRADIRAGGARRDLALAKMTLGSTTMVLMTQYAAEGRLTGGGPKGAERDEWLMTHQPYSVRVGTKWVAYNRLDPLGMLVGFAADYAEISGALDEQTGGEFVLALTAAMAKNLTSKTYMAGVADLVEALESPDQKVEQVLGRLARSFVPRAVAALERVVDPELRDPTPSPETKAWARTLERMLHEVSSQIPGWSKGLPPKRNLFGEPIRLGYGEAWEWVNPAYVKDVNTDPVAQELVRTQVKLTMPPRTIPVGIAGAPGIPLTPQEYDRLVQLAAGHGLAGPAGGAVPSLKAQLGTLMQSDAYQRLSEGPDGSKALALRSVVQGYRDAARAQLISESKSLQELIGHRAKARGEALMPRDAGGAEIRLR